VAVVTGGARGFGLVLARELMNRGAHVAVCARDSSEVDRARVDLVRQGTGKVFAMRADLTHKDELIRFIERTETVLGPIDVLINNAGVIQVGPMETMRVEDFDAALKIHFWAPLHAILAVLPQMRRRHTGRIVNITSIAAKVAVPHLLPYSASKFAGYGLSTGLRAELEQDGIIVTTVCPGLMRTGSPRHALVKGKQQQEYELFKLSDSLPGLTIGAERAARQVLDACVRGDAEVVLSLPGKMLASIYGVLPGLVQRVFGQVARALPDAEGASTWNTKGKDQEKELGPIPRLVTRLTDAASLRNNEV